MAAQLLERKLKHIRSTGATTVATANPGCLLQLVNGARAAGMNLRVAHPVTLLAEASICSSRRKEALTTREICAPETCVP
jgi:Fe-S oxidoreductase